MKKILFSPKIQKDNHGQLGQFLDLSWINFFKNKVDLITWNPKNKKFNYKFAFDGIVISGGNDLYSIKKNKENFIRDQFEIKLLKFGIKNSLPIIAVCRGFQFVNHYFGGDFQKTQNHVKKNKKIEFKKNLLFFQKNQILNVNSYHNYKIKNLSNNFINIAQANDGSTEIAYSKKFKILGLMFHPERKNVSQSNINKLIYKFFKIK